MNNCVLFSIPGNELLGHSLTGLLHAEPGEAVIIRNSENGETDLKIMSDVYGKEAIIVCSLHHPEEAILPLYFLAKTLKEFRASSVILVAPYLAYMGQDKQFTNGECASSELFAKLISVFIDKLITIDPYLNRRTSLEEIYPMHCSVLDASVLISEWIKENIDSPLLICPNSDSEQRVNKVASEAGAPFIILEKIINGNRNIQISVPGLENYKNHTPVLVNDITSTVNTMTETVSYLKRTGMKAPVYIRVHAVMTSAILNKLIKAGAEKIVTCNSIVHPSNAIKVDKLLADEVCKNCFVIH